MQSRQSLALPCASLKQTFLGSLFYFAFSWNWNLFACISQTNISVRILSNVSSVQTTCLWTIYINFNCISYIATKIFMNMRKETKTIFILVFLDICETIFTVFIRRIYLQLLLRFRIWKFCLILCYFMFIFCILLRGKKNYSYKKLDFVSALKSIK